jgi:hypothetical protein
VSEDSKTSFPRTPQDILDRHGLIVFVLYWLTEIGSKISGSHRLRALPQTCRTFRFAYDPDSDKATAWWQDIVAIAFLCLLTPSAVYLSWVSNCGVAFVGLLFSIYLLLDTVLYFSRVLWFDDLRPGDSDQRRKVTSHRRILFVAVFSFGQSIVLFPSIYHHVPSLSNSCRQVLFERSFSTATLFSLSSPITLVDVIQVSVSLFFLAIVIAVTASIAYRRKEPYDEDTTDSDKERRE